jgi:outer membrane protein assembly factor BamB
LTGEDAKRGFSDANELGTFVFVQVGSSYISAINAESANERWRFTSKANAIRSMVNRGTDLLIEAEQLLALDPSTGVAKWQYPLNCYSAKSCNTRIRDVTNDVILLSGFDDNNENIMLIDATNGQRLWPNWVQVPEATHIVYTPGTIVVASGTAPYQILGLDRYTGRKRWGFRPGGTDQPAAGLMAHDGVVTVWWSSRAVHSVYSLALDTGTPISDWMVVRRARSEGEIITGGPGYFLGYQPALFGGGGTIKVWDVHSGDTLWRKRLKQLDSPPIIYAHRLFLWERVNKRLSLTARNIKTGKEFWRFDRWHVKDYEARFDQGRVVLRLMVRSPSLFVLNMLTGKVEGAGALNDKHFLKGPYRYVNRRVFMMNGPKLLRMTPQPATSLLIQFDQYFADGQVKEAHALHKLVKPFIDDLPTAATIHRRIVGKKFQNMATKMQSGTFAAALPIFLRMAAPQAILYFADFRAFIMQLKTQLERHKLSQRLGVNDRARLLKVGDRVIELLRRFERKLNATEDKELVGSIRKVFMLMAKAMHNARARRAALNMLVDLWARSWCERGPILENRIKTMALKELRLLITPLAKSVGRNENPTAALKAILTLPGLKMVVDKPPRVEGLEKMTPEQVAGVLLLFRRAVNQK